MANGQIKNCTTIKATVPSLIEKASLASKTIIGMDTLENV